MCRRVDDSLTVRRKVAARRAALSTADQLDVGAVDIHRKNLVALVRRACGLKDDLLVIERKISLGVLASKRELLDVSKMYFFRMKLRLQIVLLRKKQARGQS